VTEEIKWKNLEYLNVRILFDSTHVLDLFGSSIFDNLTTLYIEFYNEIFHIDDETMPKNFFPVLAKSAKQLKQLPINNADVSQMELEKLHLGIPQLNKLVLI
jgi:hypothetical protein